MFMSKSVFLACALVLGSLALTGCKTKIDGSKVEDAIKSGVKEKVGAEMKSVTCPKDVEAKAGDSFECKGSAATGEELVFLVTEKDDQGNVDWKVKSVNGQIAPAAASAGPSAGGG
jgi:hypothetical protein